jgi:hypothetical protein
MQAIYRRWEIFLVLNKYGLNKQYFKKSSWLQKLHTQEILLVGIAAYMIFTGLTRHKLQFLKSPQEKHIEGAECTARVTIWQIENSKI